MNFARDVVDAAPPGRLALVELARDGSRREIPFGEAAERAARLVERRKIAAALRAHEGNKTRAAEELGVSYKTLLTKIKEYGL